MNKQKKVEDMKKTYKLLSKWTYWYHSTTDYNWKRDSYKKIYTICTLSDFWKINNFFDTQKLLHGYLFIMKDKIMPIWEDKENKNGGCWSFKIKENYGYEFYLNLSALLIGGTLTRSTNDNKYINGISVSYKNKFFYIKIWIKSKNMKKFSLFSKSFQNIEKKYSILKLWKSY